MCVLVCYVVLQLFFVVLVILLCDGDVDVLDGQDETGAQ